MPSIPVPPPWIFTAKSAHVCSYFTSFTWPVKFCTVLSSLPFQLYQERVINLFYFFTKNPITWWFMLAQSSTWQGRDRCKPLSITHLMSMISFHFHMSCRHCILLQVRFKIFYLCTYLFISKIFLINFFFGCAGSLLLLGLFSGCSKQGLLSSCSAWAPHCGGFRCCRA